MNVMRLFIVYNIMDIDLSQKQPDELSWSLETHRTGISCKSGLQPVLALRFEAS